MLPKLEEPDFSILISGSIILIGCFILVIIEQKMCGLGSTRSLISLYINQTTSLGRLADTGLLMRTLLNLDCSEMAMRRSFPLEIGNNRAEIGIATAFSITCVPSQSVVL